MRKTWIVIKEVIGKTKLKSSTLPRRLIIDGIETYDKSIIANSLTTTLQVSEKH